MTQEKWHYRYDQFMKMHRCIKPVLYTSQITFFFFKWISSKRLGSVSETCSDCLVWGFFGFSFVYLFDWLVGWDFVNKNFKLSFIQPFFFFFFLVLCLTFLCSSEFCSPQHQFFLRRRTGKEKKAYNGSSISQIFHCCWWSGFPWLSSSWIHL